MRRRFRLILGTIFVLSVIFILISLNALAKFSHQLGQPTNYFFKLAYQAAQENPYLNKDKINFLILGEDKRDDQLEKTEVTDTIILASLNLKDYKLNMVSLPRDLWSYSLESKINDIYPQSLEKGDKFPFIKEEFGKITGQEIDHVLLISTDNLIKFTSLIGGVDVELEQGFADDEYPNPDHIANPDDPSIPVYKTISFTKGVNHLNETNITEFVRSRKSAETASQGGTDIGRIERQQLLIEAIVDKIRNQKFIITERSQAIDLYKLWDQELIKDFGDLELLQIFTVLNENIEKVTLNKIEIPVGLTAKDGLIYHPNYNYQGQWVFLPSDQEYQQLHEFIEAEIN